VDLDVMAEADRLSEWIWSRWRDRLLARPSSSEDRRSAVRLDAESRLVDHVDVKGGVQVQVHVEVNAT
jgi:hypothetical protein